MSITTSTTSPRPPVALSDADPVVDQVPLAFQDFPAAASQVQRAAEIIGGLVNVVPDNVCGDCDLLEMQMDLQLIAGRLQDRAKASR